MARRRHLPRQRPGADNANPMPRSTNQPPKPAFTAAERAWMQRALALALRGEGLVEPNPMVGCVLVRGQRVIAEGFHRRFGGPHAEIEALKRCSPRATNGATAYVTLEPCCYYGKTPPCTAALITARVGRVVAAVRDPNPRVAGRGADALRKAGIRVDFGLCAPEAGVLIAPFAKWIATKRPWVILKWAQSLDGRIATRTGESKWLSDEAARAQAHRTRGRVDAIVVGVRTVLADDPELTCRAGRPARIARRVVLDTHLRTPLSARLVRGARKIPTWIVCGRGAPAARRRSLERAGCEVLPVATAAGRVSLPAVLELLGAKGIARVLVEGGGQVLGGFFDAGLADEVQLFLTPRLIGGSEAPPALAGIGVAAVADSAVFTAPPRLSKLGSGWLITGRLAGGDSGGG